MLKEKLKEVLVMEGYDDKKINELFEILELDKSGIIEKLKNNVKY